MGKPKPDQVVVHRIELQDHERKLLQSYVTAHNVDKGSEAVSQWVGTFFGTPEGMVAAYLVLDLIDRFAIPEDGFGEVLLTMSQMFGMNFRGPTSAQTFTALEGEELAAALKRIDKGHGFPEEGTIAWDRKQDDIRQAHGQSRLTGEGSANPGNIPNWWTLLTGQLGAGDIAGAVEWNAMTAQQQREAKPTQYAISKWCKTSKALIVAYWIMQNGDDWLESIGSTYADFAQGSASLLYGWIPFASAGD